MAELIKLGMIGGGEGSFIGAIHRMAARLDGYYDLCAGALSSNPERARLSGEKIGLSNERSYGSYEEMLEKESKRKDGIRVVSIVTPNYLHFAPAQKALELGFDVIIDKPLCFNLNEARELRDLVSKTKRKLAVTYTYTAYPAVIEAKNIVKEGRLGRLKKVVVQYPQGWLSQKIEDENQKQAAWRTDPNQAGESCCFADIGTHAVNLAETISGQKVIELLADLHTFVPGRKLDDDATLLLRFNQGLRGVAVVSQISTGEGNDLQVSLYGEKGGLHWTQAKPNHLLLMWADRPYESLVMGAGMSYLSEETKVSLRTPAGHPEGYIEAFANIYTAFAKDLFSMKSLKPRPYPDIEDGFRAMAVVDAALRSSRQGSKWTKVEES